ncbi:hypothetical protein EPI10_002373 [Gossypium australe]|uniref:Uncharacterized protein n=1 Tax=Gossypium australe TaxID=47621 RepID=A0A5B6VE18_9ROSI|nr:hypothetical protein EPI10_002373 [Gossypium australe]
MDKSNPVQVPLVPRFKLSKDEDGVKVLVCPPQKLNLLMQHHVHVKHYGYKRCWRNWIRIMKN